MPSIDVLPNITPIIIIKIEIIIPVKYSILSCPKGCSGSGGNEANLKPINVAMLDAQSLKLSIPSAIIEILPLNKPKIILAALNRTLLIIPIMLRRHRGGDC